MRPVVILLLFCSAILGHAQSVLYVTSGSGNLSQLYTVDPLTAQGTLIGDVLVDGITPVAVTGLAFQPGTGILFGVTGNEYSPSRLLLNIDPLTGSAVSLGVLGGSSTDAASDIAFAANGTLYGWRTKGGPLGTIDLLTGVHTAIGTDKNGTQGNGFAIAPDGTFYVAGPSGPGDLYTVNPSTGAITSLVALSNIPVNFDVINAMASDASGMLFTTNRGSGNELVMINPTTGVMTSVGVLSFGDADALAFSFVPVPEPSVWALLLVGLGFSRLVIRRR